MHIFHFVQSIDRNSGGLRSAILGITRSTSDLHDSTIYSLKTSHINNERKNKIQKISIFNLINIILFVLFDVKCKFLKNFLKTKSPIFHIHGMWMPIPFLSYLLSKKLNIPYVFSPHGGMMPFAFSYHNKRKRLALYFFQKAIFEEAQLIIVASEYEAESIRKYFKNKKIIIIPHGILLPKNNIIHKQNSKRICLYLGRVNQSKGIRELLNAWIKLSPKNWELHIAGNADQKEYLNKLKTIINEKNDIKFLGSVRGRKKINVFTSSNLFILPTKTENFGIVIAEALSYCLPVITTKAAPWEVIKEKKLGWWIDDINESLFKVLKEATDLTNKDLRIIGKRGYKYVKENLNWQEVKFSYHKEYIKLISNNKK